MAIRTGQAGTTGTVFLCQVPPGPCNVVLSTVSGTPAVSPSTAGTGFVLGSAPATFSGYPGSAGATLYVSGGVASYLISTDA